jgi:hypothetical protein
MVDELLATKPNVDPSLVNLTAEKCHNIDSLRKKPFGYPKYECKTAGRSGIPGFRK